MEEAKVAFNSDQYNNFFDNLSTHYKIGSH